MYQVLTIWNQSTLVIENLLGKEAVCTTAVNVVEEMNILRRSTSESLHYRLIMEVVELVLPVMHYGLYAP